MNTENFYFSLGRPFSPLYSMLMRVREHAYAKGVFKVHHLKVPVISVGNLTMGGTGKTPLVQYLARMLQNNGKRPAIISRGYGGSAKEKVNLVSDGTGVLMSAAASGDEPYLLAETLPGVPVLTGVVRLLPAQKAIEQGADILILDDGFQHIRLERAVNLVLFNSDTLAGNSRVFPGGHLREPAAALNRATDFIMTGVNEGNRDRAERFLQMLAERFPGKGGFLAGYKAAGYVSLDEHGTLVTVDSSQVQGKSVFGFCGIAHPELFKKTLSGTGLCSLGFKGYRDHERYTESTAAELMRTAQQNGAEALVTTEKDLVKFREIDCTLPVYAIRMEVEMDSTFTTRMTDCLQSV